MNKNIQIFQNKEFGAIRTMKDERGEPLFCSKDVCDALGIVMDEMRCESM